LVGRAILAHSLEPSQRGLEGLAALLRGIEGTTQGLALAVDEHLDLGGGVIGLRLSGVLKLRLNGQVEIVS
jgi:hypothetical protein